MTKKFIDQSKMLNLPTDKRVTINFNEPLSIDPKNMSTPSPALLVGTQEHSLIRNSETQPLQALAEESHL